MAVLLPDFGEVSYNGVVFGVKRRIDIVGEPFEDEAERTVVYNKYTITINTEITPDEAIGINAPAIDSKMEQIRKLLEVEGGKLVVNQQGWGVTFTVNDPATGVMDVKFGPKVKQLRWKPIGANRAASVLLVLETCIPDCNNALYKFGILACNFSVAWEITDGLTTRTISGYLEIPMSRWNGPTDRTLGDNADQYRDRINPPIPLGFRRRPMRWEVSKDKRRLDFTIVDEEVDSDNPPPPGAIDARIVHDLGNIQDMDFSTWRSDFAVNVRLGKGASRSTMFAAVMAIIEDRTTQATTVMDAKVLLSRFHIRDHVNSREMDIHVGMYLYTTLKDVLKAAGIWRFIPGGQGAWQTWQNSMIASKAWDNRGYANMQSNASDETIVDLCFAGDPSIATDIGNPPNQMIAVPNPFIRSCPDAANSWIRYEAWFSTRATDSRVLHQMNRVYNREDPGNTNWNNPANTTPPRIGFLSPDEDIIQTRGSPRFGLTFWGKAARLCYPIPMPKLVEYAGVRVFRRRVWDWSMKQIGTSVDGMPIFGATWCIDYDFTQAPFEELPNAGDFAKKITYKDGGGGSITTGGNL